ncbi:hypothetical protein RRG08_037747 [Elysia crispata]|uniref:Uncharacterized protein n=1 Tax=Elysia crispata TaxID=231223 RepID=A0AAE1A851_9GAST|nr:hypothetical protein RRG08_037747 [Elysia crispata]
MPQSNRRPGGGAGKLRPTLDSERSPSVHYANWKETMLLERQLSTLSRTEKSLVHGITVDQKVAFRRFQSKLQRSKITNARMWSDKEAEIELRDAGMRRLHIESHLLDDGKSDFLSKLEKRPYTAEIREEEDKKDENKFGKPVLNNAPGQRSFTVLIILKQHNVEKVTNKDTQNDLVSLSALAKKSFSENKLILKPISESTQETSSRLTQSSPAGGVSAKVNAEMKPSEVIDVREHHVKIDPSATTERQTEENVRGMSTEENVTSTASNREPIKNPRNILRPGQSTFPMQKSSESSGDDETIPSSNDICNGESNKENEAKLENSGQEILDAPVRPRNPRNRIRPGQSSFLETNKPVVSSEKPPILSDAPLPSEILSTAQSDSQATNDPGSFMKEVLTTDQSSTKAKSKCQRNAKALVNEQGSNTTNRMHHKRRSIQLRGSVPGRPSLFTEMERPDYCQMRLEAVKSVSFEARVRSFCEGIGELGESATHCDYYATKMHDMVAGQRDRVYSRFPEHIKYQADGQIERLLIVKNIGLMQNVTQPLLRARSSSFKLYLTRYVFELFMKCPFNPQIQNPCPCFSQKQHTLAEDTTTIQPCEEDLRRHMGNTAMPCITLKRVRLDAGADYDTAPYSSFSEDLDSDSFKPAYQHVAVGETIDSE